MNRAQYKAARAALTAAGLDHRTYVNGNARSVSVVLHLPTGDHEYRRKADFDTVVAAAGQDFMRCFVGRDEWNDPIAFIVDLADFYSDIVPGRDSSGYMTYEIINGCLVTLVSDLANVRAWAAGKDGMREITLAQMEADEPWLVAQARAGREEAIADSQIASKAR